MKNTLKKQRINFTQISNDLLNDKEISSTAKGIYCFMYSKPDNWNFTIKSMISQLKEGQRAISNALKELKSKGWVIYEKTKTGKGYYHILHTPIIENKPNVQNVHLPQLSQMYVSASSNNSILTKRQRINNKEELIILEEEEKKELPFFVPTDDEIDFMLNDLGFTPYEAELISKKFYDWQKSKDGNRSFKKYVLDGVKNGWINPTQNKQVDNK